MRNASVSEILRHAHSGDPWHGSSLEVILKDVTPDEAAARPIPGAHSIIELVLHMAAWAREVAARAEGRTPAEPEEKDWPEAGAITWLEARDRLATAHARLMVVLSHFPEVRMCEIVGASREAPLGTGVTYERMLVGVAEHDAYHGGQVTLLKRVLRG